MFADVSDLCRQHKATDARAQCGQKITFIRRALRFQTAVTNVIPLGSPQAELESRFLIPFHGISRDVGPPHVKLAFLKRPVFEGSPSGFSWSPAQTSPSARLDAQEPAQELPRTAPKRKLAGRKGATDALVPRNPFLGPSRLPPRLSGSSGFSRALPASSVLLPRFNGLSRHLGLFPGLQASVAATRVAGIVKVCLSPAPCPSAGFEGHTSGVLGWGCGRLPGPRRPMACAGRAGPGPRAARPERSVLPGPGHVQLQREDREAQWREAGRVRVGHLPGEGRRRGRGPGAGVRVAR